MLYTLQLQDPFTLTLPTVAPALEYTGNDSVVTLSKGHSKSVARERMMTWFVTDLMCVMQCRTWKDRRNHNVMLRKACRPALVCTLGA